MKKITSYAHKTGSWFLLRKSIELVPLWGQKNYKPWPQNRILVAVREVNRTDICMGLVLRKVDRIGTSIGWKKLQATPTKQDLSMLRDSLQNFWRPSPSFAHGRSRGREGDQMERIFSVRNFRKRGSTSRGYPIFGNSRKELFKFHPPMIISGNANRNFWLNKKCHGNESLLFGIHCKCI